MLSDDILEATQLGSSAPFILPSSKIMSVIYSFYLLTLDTGLDTPFWWGPPLGLSGSTLAFHVH